MSRIIYVNGRYSGYDEAVIHVEDRGFQFADGVYEVFRILNSTIIDLAGHLDRLNRSLSELRMMVPMSRAALLHILKETVRRNMVRSGFLYLQVTRGAATRNFTFPGDEVGSSLICLARSQSDEKSQRLAEKGICALSVPDIRWARRDIKSISLLPQMLASQAALDEGCAEALLIGDDGFVTEGSHSNAWIIDEQNRLMTRRADNSILRGITRQSVTALIEDQGLRFEQRPFTLEEALAAKEVFVTSTTALLMPVVKIDGQQIADGAPGATSIQLRRLICEAHEQQSR